MRTLTYTPTVLLVLFNWQALGQNASTPEQRGPQPLYQVTIVSRTTKALNYGYLSAPTRIDFKGTPVLAGAHGQAVVEPKRGSTLLKMRFEDVLPPTRFGAQFLTYVVWAISPDGRAQNLGELELDGSNKAKLTASTPMQTFAMIVTAEPYYSVTQPSDIVVMENMVTRDTIGKVQEVNATYELLPRKPYTFDANSQPTPTKLVGKEEYEATTTLYQALNAIQIATAQQADRYAPERIARARDIYNKARAMPVSLSKEIASLAREATQIAEDSRAIAAKRVAGEKLADEQQPKARQQNIQADEGGRAAAPDLAERTRAAVVSPAPASAPQSVEAPPPVQVDESQFTRRDPKAAENRKRLVAALPRTLEILDSTRGIVITLPGQIATSSSLQSYLIPVASAMKPYKDLHIAIEGHSDIPNSIATTERDASRVRMALVGTGVSADIISARGFGDTRPRGPNKDENRRVEIVIAGDTIGILPTWDRTYTLQPSQARR
jgi:outer membrane protein OmpA-like peptidoglycan-associated protein